MPLLEDIAKAIRDERYEAGTHTGTRGHQRRIAPEHIEYGIGNDAPEIIEPYPDDPRGPCCLIRGEIITGDVLHVIVGYRELLDPLRTDPVVFLISCYWPDPAQWDAAYRRRKRKH